MMAKRIALAVTLAIAAAPAAADEKDLYRKAYSRGFDDGYQAGSAIRPSPPSVPGTVAIQPGTVLFPGTQFDTIIDPGAAAAAFQLSPDSSIAIIPNAALRDIELKLGDQYLQDRNIILNNSTGSDQ